MLLGDSEHLEHFQVDTSVHVFAHIRAYTRISQCIYSHTSVHIFAQSQIRADHCTRFLSHLQLKTELYVIKIYEYESEVKLNCVS